MKQILRFGNHLFFHLRWQDRSGQYQFPQRFILPKSTYSPWHHDEEFTGIYAKAKNNTLVDIYRCYELWELARSVQSLPGDMIEVGVWRGGTAALLGHACGEDARLYLCDTFQGVVKAGVEDNFYQGGEHADTSIEIVTRFLGDLGLENYSIIHGVFPDESSDLVPDNTIFKFCHIDVDVYESAKSIFEWVWPKLCIGGMIIFDDYGFAACEGITKLVNQLATENQIMKIHNLNGHAILIKTTR